MVKLHYLQNTICKFYPRFQPDYDQKKILLCAVLFKLYQGGYKSFDKYLNGLKYIDEYIKETYPYMTLRLFIDDSIHRDLSIMQFLSTLDIEVVHFVPRKKFTIGKHLKGLFGTLIRFFPMFDFPNNDCSLCIPIDIDIPADDIELYMRHFDENITPFLNDEHLNISCRGRVETNRVFNQIRHNKLLPYFYASDFITRGGYPKELITDFLENVDKGSSITTVYAGHKNTKLSYTNFIYGVDEYFINYTLLDHILSQELGVRFFVSFHILSHLQKRLKYWDLKVDRHHKDIYRNLMWYTLGDEYKNITPRESFLVLEDNIQDVEIVQRLKEGYMYCLDDPVEHQVLGGDLLDIFTHSLFLQYVAFEGWIYYNHPNKMIVTKESTKGPIEELERFKEEKNIEDTFEIS